MVLIKAKMVLIGNLFQKEWQKVNNQNGYK